MSGRDRPVDLSQYFPPTPATPPGLTEPSAAYKRHAWLAVGGLLAFVAVYLGMTGYLCSSVVRRFVGVAHGGSAVAAVLSSIPALFLLVFLVRGLFVIKHGKDESLIELQRDEQPTLFAFLDRLADETRAPRPHRVYLSARVNAAVFYELSFWNLVFPTRKNLELGLGLVNVLSLDELKAVIAHEYGHFAQRSMAVGRWAYVAQQIAHHIVVSRGRIDTFLTAISNIDIRIAWIGWGLRVIVWSVRAVLDTAFRLVVMAHRALGREMEFQADRVAVSVSGSDSLIHALHRLGAADEAWTEAVNFAASERRAGRPLNDLFPFQTQALEALRRVLDEPDFGLTPKPGEGAGHRVFQQALAQPPRMWMTHPPNREREDSAKQHYVASPLDGRSAWVLFRDEEALRVRVTDALFVKVERANGNPPSVTGTPEERFAKRYQHTAMNPEYRGAYMGRAVAAWEAEYQGLLGQAPIGGREVVLAALDRAYPASLRKTLAEYRERHAEEAQLEGLKEGVLKAPGGSIRYQGRELRRKELPNVLEAVRTQRKALEAELRSHDKSVRAAHLAAAKELGAGWPAHLEQLIALLHVATHTRRRIEDEHSYLHHVLNIVLADQSVSSSERDRVLEAASNLRSALADAWHVRGKITLPPDVEARFNAEGGWESLDQQLGLPAPTSQQLGEWLNACDGWAWGAAADFAELGMATLNVLLESEAKVAAWYRNGETPEPAPSPASVPSKYLTCVVGSERERQKRLGWWDRFQTADGFIPGAMRATVAAAVLLPALGLSGNVGTPTLHIVNGLAQTVKVTVGDQKFLVAKKNVAKVDINSSGSVTVRAETNDGEFIETFEADTGGAFDELVYDVAQATPLVQWTALYTKGTPPPPVPQGAPRWFIARQDDVFRQPPRTVSSKAPTTRRVLEADFEGARGESLVTNPDERRAMITAHAKFDPVTEPELVAWLYLGIKEPSVLEVVRVRAEETRAVVLERFLQDALPADEKTARCEQLGAASNAKPDDGDLRYLAIRCLPESERSAAYIAAWEQNRQAPWLSWAAANDLGKDARWADSLAAWERVLTTPALRSMRDMAALESLRTVRAANEAGHKLSVPNWVVSPPTFAVGLVQAVEGTSVPQDAETVPVYRSLNQGRLDDAKRVAHGGQFTREFGQHIDLLIAGSDGATDAQRAAVLRLNPSQVNERVRWVVAALAARAGEDAGPWLEPEDPNDEPLMTALAEILAPGAVERSPARVDELARSLPLRERGVVYGAAAIVRGLKAPANWRREAKVLLTPIERPHLK